MVAVPAGVDVYRIIDIRQSRLNLEINLTSGGVLYLPDVKAVWESFHETSIRVSTFAP